MLSHTPTGLFCEAGGFHIDPSKAVDVAVITHAHSDHARRGSRVYYCAETCVGLLRVRLGPKIDVRGVPYRQPFQLGRARVSFHPAGHILGAAQVRIEVDGRVWVASGDYKRDSDPSCEPFEVVPCEAFVTEATFGKPMYKWPEANDVYDEIAEWWRGNAAQGRASVLQAYSLGKTQRVLAALSGRAHGHVFLDESAMELTRCYAEAGIRMVPYRSAKDATAAELRGSFIISPGGAKKDYLARVDDYETAFASGWMIARNSWFRGRFDRSFVLSDHADFPSLVRTVRETGARQVYVMYGDEAALAKELARHGIDARPVTALRSRGSMPTRLEGLPLFTSGAGT